MGELGADSLDIVETVMALEEAFDIELPDEETTKLKNIQDVGDPEQALRYNRFSSRAGHALGRPAAWYTVPYPPSCRLEPDGRTEFRDNVSRRVPDHGQQK